MSEIRTDGSLKRLVINGDPNRVIEFDPSDVLFIEKFYQLFRDFEAKQAEITKRAKELDEENKRLADAGEPLNLAGGLTFLKEVCTFLREGIDGLFGEGTSQKAFGDSLSLDAITQFFDGVGPHIWETRSLKIKRYNKHP